VNEVEHRPARPRLPGRAAVAALLALGAGAPASAATYRVVIEAMAYHPHSLRLVRGDRIVWLNRDVVPHTVTADGEFDSGAIAPGGQWSLVVGAAERIAYRCAYHPTMHGTLEVR
jgi:plastocyanin